MIVHSLRTRALLVTPIRFVLGVILLVGARAAGAGGGPALLGFAVGGVGVAFLAFNDPRARLASGSVAPLGLPREAVIAPAWRQAVSAMIPSTIGVTLLGLVALPVKPVLSAVLAGICAGLGLASLLSLARIDPQLFAAPKSHIIYRGRH